MIQRATANEAREESRDAESGPAIEPLALAPKDAAQALSIGERTLWALTNSGELPHLRLGRKVLYPVHMLRDFLTERAEATQKKSGRR